VRSEAHKSLPSDSTSSGTVNVSPGGAGFPTLDRARQQQRIRIESVAGEGTGRVDFWNIPIPGGERLWRDLFGRSCREERNVECAVYP